MVKQRLEDLAQELRIATEVDAHPAKHVKNGAKKGMRVSRREVRASRETEEGAHRDIKSVDGLEDIAGACTLHAGEYALNHDIVIPEGAVLTIRPDTTLRFKAGCGVRCFGTLRALGAESYTISIKFLPQESQGGWSGIYMAPKSVDSVLQYCEIAYVVGRSISLKTGEWGGPTSLGSVSCIGTSAKLDHCNLHHGQTVGTGAGIYALKSTVTIQDCAISHNQAPKMAGGITLAEGRYIVRKNRLQANTPSLQQVMIYKSNAEIGQNVIDSDTVGIHCMDSTANIWGNTISTRYSDGIVVSGGEVRIAHNHFIGKKYKGYRSSHEAIRVQSGTPLCIDNTISGFKYGFMKKLGDFMDGVLS